MTAANSQKQKRIDHLHDGIDPWSGAAQERATHEQKLKIAEANRAGIHEIAAFYQVIDANFATYECHARKLNSSSLRHTEIVRYRSIALFGAHADEAATKTEPHAANSKNSSIGPADEIELSEIVFHDGPQEFFQVFFPFQNNDRLEALRKPLDCKLSNLMPDDDGLYCARIRPVTAAEAANLNS